MIRVAAALAVLVTACAPAASADTAPPPDHGAFDYQLGGADDSRRLAVVARDASDQPSSGAYDICYVNGFQTQPGAGAEWLNVRPDAVLRDGTGAPVTDPDWPDEYVLDPSTPERRDLILDGLGPIVKGCATAGFDAVEIDNLDTFTRFADISKDGAFALAKAYVTMAHEQGLAIGQKNAAEFTADGRSLGFDFAVAEECAAYGECDAYAREYGRHVLQIEYVDNLPRPFDEVCASPDRAPLTILRDRDLVPSGAPGHVYRQCP